MPDDTAADDLSFPLARLGRFLREMPVPAEGFDAKGSHATEYGVLTLTGRGSGTGRLHIGRTADAAGPTIDVVYEKRMIDGGMHRTESRIRCRDDALLTPRSWTVSSTVTGPKGEAVPDLTDTATFRIEGDELVSAAGEREVRRPLPPGPRALNWALFAAAGVLGRDRASVPEFTLIDHFDQVKPGHALRFRGTGDLVIGGHDRVEFDPTPLERGRLLRPVRRLAGATRLPCNMVAQTGPGIVPIIYITDPEGRLLIASSGLEAYIVAPQSDAQGGRRP
jgi:hypothetical protein